MLELHGSASSIVGKVASGCMSSNSKHQWNGPVALAGAEEHCQGQLGGAPQSCSSGGEPSRKQGRTATTSTLSGGVEEVAATGGCTRMGQMSRTWEWQRMRVASHCKM